MKTHIPFANATSTVSDLELDQYLRGELEQSARQKFEVNVPDALLKRLNERRAERDAFIYQAPPFSQIRDAAKNAHKAESSSWFSWRVLAGFATVAAALLIFLVAPRAPQVLSKGSAMNFYVKRGDTVLQTKALRPGDRLRFELSASGEKYGAVLSLDGSNTVSVYAPLGSTMTKFSGNLRFDHSTELDGVLGRERLVAFLCQRPLPLSALKRVMTSKTITPPVGCEHVVVDAQKSVP